MTDAGRSPEGRERTAAATAGGMLRTARQAQGLHIAALAASIKVAQRKLEALEGDRYDELPDMTFTRALAKTVCRSLKIDATPVLALLPQLGDQGLDKVHQGLNAAFRDRPGRIEPTDLGVLLRPALWLPLVLILAAGAVYLLPQHWTTQTRLVAGAASAAAPSLSQPAAAASATVESAPVFPPEVASSPHAVPTDVSGLLVMSASAESWVEALDANGVALVQRMLQPGETLGLDGTPPFRLKIGNAAATRLSFRGEPVDLAPATRDNVARLELK